MEGNVYPPVKMEENVISDHCNLYITDADTFFKSKDINLAIVTPEGFGVRYPL